MDKDKSHLILVAARIQLLLCRDCCSVGLEPNTYYLTVAGFLIREVSIAFANNIKSNFMSYNWIRGCILSLLVPKKALKFQLHSNKILL